ncbi:MAG: hypothetical protein ACRC6E_05745 [Fusobacteriaceae bacterium]
MLDFNRLDEAKWVLDSEMKILFLVYSIEYSSIIERYIMCCRECVVVKEADWKVFKVKVANYFLSEVN